MRSEIFSTPVCVECDKMYRSTVWVQEFWYIVSGGSGLDIQPEQSENDNPARKKKLFQVAKNDDSCTLLFIITIRIYGSVVKASRSESGKMSSILAVC